jgi:hypothetical protein
MKVRSHNVQVGGPRPPLHRKSNEALSVITRGRGYQLLTAAACTAVRTLSETTELCFERSSLHSGSGFGGFQCFRLLQMTMMWKGFFCS